MVNLFEIFKTFPDLSRQLKCKDLLLTQYECPQRERREKFYLETNVVIYVISGRRTFLKDNHRIELSAGICVFLKRGTHIAEMEEGEGWCVMAFFMPDVFLKQLINENEKTLPLATSGEATTDHILPLEVNDLSRSFFLSMQAYFSQTPPPPENLVELKFKELILSLLSQKQNKPLLSYLNALRNDKHPTVADVVQNNYTFNLTLADYAKLACKSVPTFKREFRKIFNDSPAKWVMKKRLSLAAELLENTNKSVAEITYECGFENQTHFSRIFREKMGTSPLKFRSKIA